MKTHRQGIPTATWILLLLWLVGALLTVFIPVGTYKANMEAFYLQYGRFNEAEQNQQQQYNNQENNYNQGQYNGRVRRAEEEQRQYEQDQYQQEQYNAQQMEQELYDEQNVQGSYPKCTWYQFKCMKARYYFRQQAANREEGNGNGGFLTPDWYRKIGGALENDREFYEEMGIQAPENSDELKFVYSWSLLMYFGLIAYGSYVVIKGKDLIGLVVALAIFAQFALLHMITLGQGVIKTDQEELKDTIYGWFGQLGVLMVYTDYAYIWFCIIFAVLFIVAGIAKSKSSRYTDCCYQKAQTLEDDLIEKPSSLKEVHTGAYASPKQPVEEAYDLPVVTETDKEMA